MEYQGEKADKPQEAPILLSISLNTWSRYFLLMGANVTGETQISSASTFTKTYFTWLFSSTLDFSAASVVKPCTKPGFIKCITCFTHLSQSVGTQSRTTSILKRPYLRIQSITSSEWGTDSSAWKYFGLGSCMHFIMLQSLFALLSSATRILMQVWPKTVRFTLSGLVVWHATVPAYWWLTWFYSRWRITILDGTRSFSSCRQ